MLDTAECPALRGGFATEFDSFVQLKALDGAIPKSFNGRVVSLRMADTGYIRRGCDGRMGRH